MRVQNTGIKAILTGSMMAMLVCMNGMAAAENSAPLSLKMVPVPQPTGGDIIDQDAAVRLGKALFWDMQTGGDGMIACATCHFHAGADTRLTNTVNPGPDGLFQSEGVTGPGQTIQTLTNITTDDRVGSQGIVGSLFISVDPNSNNPADECADDQTAPFFQHRRVTGRNAPTVIGAVFNRDNFWDGRANHNFNGVDPFGATANAGAAAGGLIGNSSLASQADGPPNNGTEMSCAGRPFNGENSLAAKLLARPALQYQYVDLRDSVLGTHSAWPTPGLQCGDDLHPCMYTELIEAAFGPGYDAQNKFSRIWGQAIQAYEATLIPDRTPMDRYLAGDKTALTSSQQIGLNILSGKGKCTTCHAGAELTDASLSFAAQKGLINEDGGDQGFHNNGVRPTAEDPGRAGTGPNNVSFSQSGSPKDHGAFKTPSLRNVKLTAPYFHNGGKATLEDVVDFYNRGGDFANPEKAKRIRPLSLSATDKAALVDLLKNGLTDCRVEKEQAPFDHPSLDLPNGPSRPAVGAAGLGGSCP